jgi:DNA polymerase-3 subunit epsilon
MGRCMSPCLNDLDPNVYRRRLDEALGLFTGDGDGGAALIEHLDGQMRAAAAAQRYERAAWLRRRRERIAALVGALDGALAATHARPRLVLAPHPRVSQARYDAFWLVGGRVADWVALEDAGDIGARTAAALRGGDVRGGAVQRPAEAVAEARIVQTWLAEREAIRALDLDPAPRADQIAGFLAAAAAPSAIEGKLDDLGRRAAVDVDRIAG